MAENLHFLAAAALAFALFLGIAIATRVGRHAAPIRSLSRLHLAVVPSYFGFLCYLTGSVNVLWAKPLDCFVGLYLYFAFHYAFFMHFFGQITRGFSMNICVLLYQRKNKATVSDVLSGYGNGAGIEYVQSSRIQVMKESGTLIEHEGRLSLKPFGRFAVRLNRFLLGLWGLDYLGRR